MNIENEVALIAIKGGRFIEAENIFNNEVQNNATSGSFIGLAFCKLNLIFEAGRTVEEINYCLNRALELCQNDSDKKIIEQNFIFATINVMEQIRALYWRLDDQVKQQNKDVFIGAALSYGAARIGLNSSSTFTQIASLAVAVAGVGICLDGLHNLKTIPEIQKVLRLTYEGLEKCCKTSITFEIDLLENQLKFLQEDRPMRQYNASGKEIKIISKKDLIKIYKHRIKTEDVNLQWKTRRIKWLFVGFPIFISISLIVFLPIFILPQEVVESYSTILALFLMFGGPFLAVIVSEYFVKRKFKDDYISPIFSSKAKSNPELEKLIKLRVDGELTEEMFNELRRNIQSKTSINEQLSKLTELMQKGLISEVEFASMKTKVLQIENQIDTSKLSDDRSSSKNPKFTKQGKKWKLALFIGIPIILTVLFCTLYFGTGLFKKQGTDGPTPEQIATDYNQPKETPTSNSETNSKTNNNDNNSLGNDGEERIVVPKLIYLRNGPSTNYEKEGEIYRGEHFFVLKTEYDDRDAPWHNINYKGGNYWVSGSYTASIEAWQNPTMKTVIVDNAIFYNPPNKQNQMEPSKNSAPYGAQLKTFGQELWEYIYCEYEVNSEKYITGWVKKSNLQ
jgi:hypothetical protein